MISSDSDIRISYNCNGSLSVFSFSFPLIQSSDIKVTLRNKTTLDATVLAETTDYVVKDINGNEGVSGDFANGGTITTTVLIPYSSNYSLTLERVVPYTQPHDFTEGSPTLYENFELSLDRIEMQIQQLKDRLNRSITIPSVDVLSLDMEMPDADSRADKYLKFDSNGEPTAVSNIDASSIGITAFGILLAECNDGGEARTLLDIDDTISDALYDHVPAGCMMKWPTETPPSGWLIRDGSSLAIADHSGLYAVIGKMFGSVDAEHFNLPNDLGLFERNWDNGEGVDPDAASRTKPTAIGVTIEDGDHVGTEQTAETESHAHTASSSTSVSTVDNHAHSISIYSQADGTSIVRGSAGAGDGATKYTGAAGTHTHTVTVTTTVNADGGNETRPINRAYLPIIKDG